MSDHRTLVAEDGEIESLIAKYPRRLGGEVAHEIARGKHFGGERFEAPLAGLVGYDRDDLVLSVVDLALKFQNVSSAIADRKRAPFELCRSSARHRCVYRGCRGRGKPTELFKRCWVYRHYFKGGILRRS